MLPNKSMPVDQYITGNHDIFWRKVDIQFSYIIIAVNCYFDYSLRFHNV